MRALNSYDGVTGGYFSINLITIAVASIRIAKTTGFWTCLGTTPNTDSYIQF